jgi:hypothetical protein
MGLWKRLACRCGSRICDRLIRVLGLEIICNSFTKINRFINYEFFYIKRIIIKIDNYITINCIK